jgi:hypothetical protein
MSRPARGQIVKRSLDTVDAVAMITPVGERHAFEWTGSPAVDPSELAAIAAPERRRRTHLWAAGLCAVGGAAAIGVLVFGGGGGAGGVPVGGGGAAVAATPVSLAADITSNEPGYRFTLALGDGVNLTMSGTGAISTGASPSGSMSFTIGGRSVNEVLAGPYIYIQSPTSAERWYRASTAAFANSDAAGGASLSGGDPAQTLASLRAAGSVSDEGSQTIGAVATTHYRALVDLGRYTLDASPAQRANAARYAQLLEHLTGSATLPVDVWIDGSNLVRRIQIDLPLSIHSVHLDETITMNLFDYGPQAAALPPAGQVTDITGQISSQLSQTLKQLGG